jgi:glycosyltransferase involved in cell wall biosynthesis
MQAVLLAERFIKRGHEAILVGKRFGDLPGRDRIRSVPVWRVGGAEGNGQADSRALLRVLVRERRRYDTLLFFNVDGGFQGFWLWLPCVKALRKPTVARFTIARSAETVQRRLSNVVPCLLHNRIITISTALTDTVKQLLPARFHRNVTQISNGVDTMRFRPLDGMPRAELCTNLGLDPSYRYCVFIGRLSQRKGLDLLVQAWRHVVTARPDTRLLLVGPRRDTYRAVEEKRFLQTIDDYVRTHSLQESVVEVGLTDNIEQYLQVADAFLSTSRREGCPNALLEAMATGTPVVASRISGTTDDLISHSVDGFITAPEPAAFASAVIALLTSAPLRKLVGETARRTVQQQHDIDCVADRYLEILAACH